MRTCVIFNPAARGEKAQRFRKFLETIENECTLMQTTGMGAARTLAAQAVNEEFEHIVAAGGDGTLNEVVNGIGDANGFGKTALGVLPLGTVNVFARELMIPRNLDSAWKTIRAGHVTKIDLPKASFTANSVSQERYFVQLAGAGLDARAVELVHWSLKKRIGALAYVVAGLQALTEPAPRIRIESDNFSTDGKFVLVGNGRLYGGEFKIFPAADVRDGLLDVCVFPKTGWLTLGRCAPQLLLRGTLPISASKCLRTERFTLRSDEKVPLELDGELVGHLPATFSIERERLPVIVPG